MYDKIGKYEIRREIGRGAMGVVYEGYDPVIGRRVAVKTLRTEMFEPRQLPGVLERFKREAQSAGRLAHPHIVTIHDYGEHEGTPYFVMEFIAGRELGSDLARGLRYSLDDAVRLMTQLLGALAHAHENGVVHRDVKPANIFVLEDGSLKVVDFGIARVEESDLTDTGALMGTPAYMSPEQFLGLTADQRSDIYSAGVIFYQLLTGDKPFTGSVTTIMQKVLRQEPLPPSDLNQTLSDVWDTVVGRAMAKKPEARYETALAFSEAIKLAYRGAPPDMTVSVELKPTRTDMGEQARAEILRQEAQREAEERARLAAEETIRAEDRRREEEARRQEEEKVRREAEEKARREADEKARRDAEEKAQREAEEKARREAEEIARRKAEEETRREADEKARREAEEKARREAEDKARREAEDRFRLEAEARAKVAAQQAEDVRRKEGRRRERAEEKERSLAKPPSRRWSVLTAVLIVTIAVAGSVLYQREVGHRPAGSAAAHNVAQTPAQAVNRVEAKVEPSVTPERVPGRAAAEKQAIRKTANGVEAGNKAKAEAANSGEGMRQQTNIAVNGPQRATTNTEPAPAKRATEQSARTRAEIEQARRDAEARAQAEIAKARADAEAARQKAAAASAAKEKATLEAKAQAAAEIAKARAEAQARADAQIAKARAEEQALAKANEQADALKRKAEAEAEALKHQAQANAAAAKVAVAKTTANGTATQAAVGPWVAHRSCSGFKSFPPFSDELFIARSGAEFRLVAGESGHPGYIALSGAATAGGSLVLAGRGIAPVGRTFRARLEGHEEDNRYVLKGNMGERKCTLTISRAPASAAPPTGNATKAVASAIADGAWTARLWCKPFERYPATKHTLAGAAKGGRLTFSKGAEGKPGFFSLAGTIAGSGTLKLSGQVIVGTGPAYGKYRPMQFAGQITTGGGKVSGYIGKRPCEIALAPR